MRVSVWRAEACRANISGMASDSSHADVLRAHVAICEQLHELFLEESRLLRTTQQPPPEELLARKREFLPQLDASLEQLKRINAASPRFTAQEEALVQEGRRSLLKLLMLDRENERLLLRAAMPAPVKAAFAPVAPGRIARLYGRHTGPGSSLGSEA